MSAHHCLLPCRACGGDQLVPSAATTVLMAGSAAGVAFACPGCGSHETFQQDPEKIMDAMMGDARRAPLHQLSYKKCGGCDVISALPASAFTIFAEQWADTTYEWTCLVCTPSQVNAFLVTNDEVGTAMIKVMAAQGATVVGLGVDVNIEEKS